MKPKRIKQSVPAIQTRVEMETLVGEIAALELDERNLKTEMDGRMMEIRAEYEGRLTEIESQTKEKLARAQDWAEAHPNEFGKRKSIEMFHGTVGWRTGTSKLKMLSGWTWAKVLEVLKFDGRQAYIRIVEEVNKNAIIADREILAPDEMRNMGIRVVQEESFFVQPKEEKITPAPIAGKEAA